jgi:hypothetical protein
MGFSCLSCQAGGFRPVFPRKDALFPTDRVAGTIIQSCSCGAGKRQFATLVPVGEEYIDDCEKLGISPTELHSADFHRIVTRWVINASTSI